MGATRSGILCAGSRCRWRSTTARSSITRCAACGARSATRHSASSCCLLNSRSPSASTCTKRCSASPSTAATSGGRSSTGASSSQRARTVASEVSAHISSGSPSRHSACVRSPMVSSKPELNDLVALALREDLGGEMWNADVTTDLVVDPELKGEAKIIAKTPGVLSGADAAARVFEAVRPPCEYFALVPDGASLEPGQETSRIVGPLGSILTAERAARQSVRRRHAARRRDQPRPRKAGSVGGHDPRGCGGGREGWSRPHLGRGAHALRARARPEPGGDQDVAVEIISLEADAADYSRRSVPRDVASISAEIRQLARARNAVVLAHNYQVPEVQDVADYVGDSLGLSRQAAANDAAVIVIFGVHIMTEPAALPLPDTRGLRT